MRRITNFIIRCIRNTIGMLVFYSLPNVRNRFLQYRSNVKDLKGFCKFLYNALFLQTMREYYSNRTSSKRREELKRMCMGQDSGVEWADSYAAMRFPAQDEENNVLCVWLEDLLKSGKVKKVHQVACSSGREIAYFASRYPGIEFIGSDLDEKIIHACRKRWGDRGNLKFEVLRLDDLGEGAIKQLSGDLIFDSSGLQYLDEALLRNFLQKIRPLAKYLLFIEAVSVDFIMDKNKHSAPRGGFSWSHPYTDYMREAGWVDVEHKVCFKEEYYWAKTVLIKGHSGR